MRQLVLSAPGCFSDRTVEPPSIFPGEALVQIDRVGVCGSDFHAFAGRHPAYVYPRVLGHELAGIVVAVAENPFGIREGDRCAIDPYVNCQSCSMCCIGRTNCCEKLEVLGVHRDGGMQNLLAVPLRLLHRSTTLSTEELALVETLGIGAHAVARSGIGRGESALVVGAGPIGLGVALFVHQAGASVVVIERNIERREFAEQQGFTVRASGENLEADVVFDATGSSRAMSESLQLVAFGGKLVFVGLTGDPVHLNDSRFHKREITLLASRNSTHQFPRIIRLLESGAISVQGWVTHRLSISQLSSEFAGLSQRPGLIKAMISFDSGGPASA